jgi:hypothetical protein
VKRIVAIIVVHFGGDTNGVPFDMPDKKLIECIEKWLLTPNEEPDFFSGHTNGNQKLVIHFPLVGAMSVGEFG